MSDDKGPGPSQDTKTRPPRTKPKKRNPFGKIWLLVLVLIVGAAIVAGMIRTPRWVFGDGYLITDRAIELRSSVEAPLESRLVSSGDMVTAGQHVIKLDDKLQLAALEESQTLLQQQQTLLKKTQSKQKLQRAQDAERVQRAQRKVALNETTVARTAEDEDTFTDAEREEAKLKLELAQSELAEAELDREDLMARELEVIQQAVAAIRKRMDVLEAELQQRRIQTPIQGRVHFTNHKPGEWVKPEHVLGQVFDESQWIVKMKISERYRRHVTVGQPCLISVTAYPKLQYGYARGHITEILDIVNPEATGDNAYYAEAVITDFGQIKPDVGQSARVWIDTGETSYLAYVLGL